MFAANSSGRRGRLLLLDKNQCDKRPTSSVDQQKCHSMADGRRREIRQNGAVQLGLPLFCQVVEMTNGSYFSMRLAQNRQARSAYMHTYGHLIG
jgi:hypothetical protein